MGQTKLGFPNIQKLFEDYNVYLTHSDQRLAFKQNPDFKSYETIYIQKVKLEMKSYVGYIIQESRSRFELWVYSQNLLRTIARRQMKKIYKTVQPIIVNV